MEELGPLHTDGRVVKWCNAMEIKILKVGLLHNSTSGYIPPKTGKQGLRQVFEAKCPLME